jgi:hypothetical protein
MVILFYVHRRFFSCWLWSSDFLKFLMSFWCYLVLYCFHNEYVNIRLFIVPFFPFEKFCKNLTIFKTQCTYFNVKNPIFWTNHKQ